MAFPIRKLLLVSLLSALGSAGALAAEQSHFEHFITRDGAALKDGDRLFRFAGIHAPELHRIEDDARGTCKADPRGWGQYFKWPTAEEQENWIKALVQTGAKAQRVYVLSVQQENDAACGRETHILSPETPNGMPRLNEAAMKVYDNMIAEADKQGLRLILPFIDHWWWWGGREQLASFYHEKPEDFYRTDSKTFQAYLDVIRQVITRTNTITGRHYYDEKAIMAWETGNELEDTNADFLHQTSAWIRKWAPHQLVVDGTYKKVNDFALSDPNVDIISNHYYTNANNNHPGQVRKDLEAIGGKKVYLTRVGKDISDGKNEWDPSKMSLFRDNYRSLTLGQTYYYRVIAKNESGQSAPSNVIRLKHMQKNLPPVITLQDMLSTTVDKGVQLNAAWQDDNLPGPKVSVAWSHDGKNNVHFCNSSKEETRVWFSAPGDYALTFTADDGLLESSKTINVSVKPAVRPVPADYCSFGSGTMDVSKGTLNSIKSEKDTLAIGEDGFLGPFAHDGDSVSWQVSAPWDGKFTLHVKFNGKWGSKKNSFIVNDGTPVSIEFPQTDEKGKTIVVPVSLKEGGNTISFGKFTGDWGYMFIKSIEVTAE